MAPKTPEEIREAARNRQRAKRDRDRLAREQANQFAQQPDDISPEQVTSDHFKNLEWAEEFDAQGKFYKSECRPLVQLLAIYEGANILDEESNDEEEVGGDKLKNRKKEQKQNRPLPCRQAIRIRQVEFEDNSIGDDLKITVKVEPDQWEYTTLKGDTINLKQMFEVNEVVSFRRWLDLRDKGRKDLLWLARVAGKNLYHASHQMICDMFVKKDFDGLYFPEFDQDDLHAMIGKQKRFAVDGVTPTRTMLLMAPRSGYKSTIDGLDAVQWMLNAPDIRIMLITAFRNLAKTFLGEIKQYYYLPKRGKPTNFHLLYPEYVLTGVDGTSKEPIWCPAQTLNSKEPHLWITSMESSATGLRCDIRKADDAVDPKNSKTEELRENFAYDFNGTGDLVEPWGFTDIIGTRYFVKDYYGTRMSKDSDGNDPEPYNYLHIAAWKPKPKYKAIYEQLLKTPNGMFQVTAEMVDLWFPQKLSFPVLRGLLQQKKERSFKNQQLNIATDPKEVDDYINHFDQDGLRAHSYARTAAPVEMEIIQSWDTAYSDKKTSDFSVGATLGIYKTKEGRYGVVVLEILYDKWKESELMTNMLRYYEKWRPKVVFLENINGTETFVKQLKNLAKLKGSDIISNLRTVPVSVKPNAKRLRIMDLEFLLAHDLLWFVTGAWIDETFKQLTEYNGAKSTAYRKDDIPDAISLGVVTHLPVTALQHNPDPKDVEKEHEQRVAKANREAVKNRMFGQSFSQPKPQPLTEAPPPPRDPRQELMKKVVGKILPPGMRI